ncbi:GrpB family protein [filamentous cyanobacterium LEGE 11480]|uniref:GrpB family protein n=1 Tax=Romeriopsis navalis LEGE 11480 TaxID=2777977 RepID=A0A928Z3T4_9CYAN|nr:GrpB family protein [Romeriopsis navalis]MBE9030332.1 GrpB family protein [Romeriopsis navalis LEGE 11480]
MRKVEVVPHDVRWRSLFEQETDRIAQALGKNFAAAHHIGSTAIPGIYAKPIIDLLIEVHEIVQVDRQAAAMVTLGYEAMGEFGIPDRRLFRKDNQAGIRTHHVHMFPNGSAQVTRHVDFRDYMIAHPEVAQQYSDLKRQLAQQHPTDIEAYMDGKHDFIQNIDRQIVANKMTSWVARLQ